MEQPSILVKILHSIPHVNYTFRRVNDTFNPDSDVYLEVSTRAPRIPRSPAHSTCFPHPTSHNERVKVAPYFGCCCCFYSICCTIWSGRQVAPRVAPLHLRPRYYALEVRPIYIDCILICLVPNTYIDSTICILASNSMCVCVCVYRYIVIYVCIYV